MIKIGENIKIPRYNPKLGFKEGDEIDFLHFIHYINIINKNLAYLYEYRIKGWIYNELQNFDILPTKTRNVEQHISSVRDRYIKLFSLPIVETRNDLEKSIVDLLWSQHENYAEKFFLLLDFYLENPGFYKNEFSTKIVINAMKDYENKILSF